MRVSSVLFSLLSPFSLSTAAAGQVATGSLVGTVVDSSGQVVPGATVTVRNVNRNTTTALTTDATGVYTAPFLVPGTYEVSVELQGFKTWARRGIVLQVNDRLRIDATLEVGTLTEETTVVAEAPLVRTDSSEVGTVIEEIAVKELPLNGRNFATLVYLAPGITPGQAGENLSGASTFNPRGASNFNALGSQANSNAWLVDGIDNNEFTFNTVIVSPSVEQVREFKVLSGVFSAEFGRGAGVVSVSTKSGTNKLHGTAYEFMRNDAFDARNFFVRKVVAPDGSLIKDPVPPLDRHQFGGAIGGALVIPGLYDGHSRTFFFADYAGIKEKRGVTTVNTVPTAATRIGDFSDYRDRNGNLIPIYDPLTTRVDAQGRTVRDQFPNNIIPQDRILSVGRNIASIYPLPNNPGSNFDNYISTPNREITDKAFSGRVDHRLSDNDSFFVRFNYGKFKLDAPQGQANCCLPTPAEAAARFDLGPFVAGIQNTKLTTHGAAFNYSKILSPTLVNELRIGYANTAPFTTQSDYGINASTSLGIQGINISDITTGLPNIGITNFTGLSGGPAFLPVNPSQFHYQVEDVLVWLKGRHQVKFGYRLVDRRPSPFIHDNTRSGINFGTSFVNNPVTNSGGTGLAAVLLGYFNNATRGFLLEKPEFRVIEHGTFVQDDFKLNDRLTVNAGLRYEIFMPPTEKNNRLANFDYQNYVIVYAGENGASRSANKKTQYGDLAPRLGLTYKLTSDASTILRTGFGITYFPSPYAAGNLNHLNVPFVISQNVQHETNPLNNMAGVRTIADPFPPIVPVKPTTTAELIAANPRVAGHSYENETAYAEQWHLGIDHQLFAALLLEVGYAGSASKHLMLCYNPNEIQPGPGTQNSRRLLQPINSVTNMLQCDPRNRSTFHAGTLKLQKRFSNGYQFLVSYTYGKSLDYGASAASGGGAVGGGQTITNMDAWKGPSGFDTRHRAVISYVYELPFGSGRAYMADSGAVMQGLVGGWQLSGITTLTTGRPFSVSLQTGVNNGAPSWPDRIGSGKLDDPTVDLWFNTADFVAPPQNTYGNAGRGILYGPGHVNFDTSLSKRFASGGGSTVEVRWDVFNLFNHPGFGFPNSTIGNPSAGRITNTIVDNRSMQFALKFNF